MPTPGGPGLQLTPNTRLDNQGGTFNFHNGNNQDSAGPSLFTITPPATAVTAQSGFFDPSIYGLQTPVDATPYNITYGRNMGGPAVINGDALVNGPATPPSSSGVALSNNPQTSMQLLSTTVPNSTQTLGQLFASNGFTPSQAQAYVTSLLSKNTYFDPSSGNYLTNLSGSNGLISSDQVFYGMAYATHNFTASSGPDTVTVQGAVCAYGGNPANYSPSTPSTYPGGDGTGTLAMQGTQVNFVYDPTYLGAAVRVYANKYIPATRLFLAVY